MAKRNDSTPDVHIALDLTQPEYGAEPIAGEPRGRLFMDRSDSLLRIVLDSQTVDCEDLDCNDHFRPDIAFEWRGTHWLLTVHPHAGDPVLFIKFFESTEKGGFYSIIAEDPDEGREDVELWDKSDMRRFGGSHG